MADYWTDAFNLVLDRLDNLVNALVRIAEAVEAMNAD